MSRPPQETRMLSMRKKHRLLPFTIIAVGLAVVLLVGYVVMSGSNAEASTGLEFVIPGGASETVEVPTINSVIEIPTEIVFTADDTAMITIRNDDKVANRAGPWVIGPGQSYSIRFDNPGEYFFACSVDPLESVTVIVEEP